MALHDTNGRRPQDFPATGRPCGIQDKQKEDSSAPGDEQLAQQEELQLHGVQRSEFLHLRLSYAWKRIVILNYMDVNALW